jgi:hypothetical protein
MVSGAVSAAAAGALSQVCLQRRCLRHINCHVRFRNLLLASIFAGAAASAAAATSAACTGGGFSALGKSGKVKIELSGSQIPATIAVRGKYVEFDVDSATLAVRNYVLTGAANSMDITGGVRTPVFASKVPDLKGATLTGRLELELKDGGLVLQRKGGAVDMKIQAKDCAQGGIFQMEAERDDGQATLFTHTLATNTQNANITPFYFDNRNFRNREGDQVPFGDLFMTVPARVNFGNDFSPRFVGRDSPQLATRRSEATCNNTIINRDGQSVSVKHCGGVSRWDVQSGGRMGMVMGEDAVEVAPSATECDADCQARNQVNGKALVLGFPFPVAPADRLNPRAP